VGARFSVHSSAYSISKAHIDVELKHFQGYRVFSPFSHYSVHTCAAGTRVIALSVSKLACL